MRKILERIFLYCFDPWWRAFLCSIIVEVLLAVNGEWGSPVLRKPLIFLSNVALVMVLIASVYQFYKGRVIKGLIPIIVIFTIGFASCIYTMVDGDHWADDLVIPKDISLDDPVNKSRRESSDSINSLVKTQPDLVLYNSSQPGIYEYDFWTDRIEQGTIYLKAFEITQEEELSDRSLKKSTFIPVHDPDGLMSKFGSERSFTIYKGDWDKFYAARFEVWLRPSSGAEERKIFEKNFKIQGWMH